MKNKMTSQYTKYDIHSTTMKNKSKEALEKYITNQSSITFFFNYLSLKNNSQLVNQILIHTHHLPILLFSTTKEFFQIINYRI